MANDVKVDVEALLDNYSVGALGADPDGQLGVALQELQRLMVTESKIREMFGPRDGEKTFDLVSSTFQAMHDALTRLSDAGQLVTRLRRELKQAREDLKLFESDARQWSELAHTLWPEEHMEGTASDAIEERQELRQEVERLRGLIKDHNTACVAACNERFPDCDPYLSRNLRCPNCPREWTIVLEDKP